MNIYREQLRLRHHQCGADCKLKLKSIFDIFQDAAADHADILGGGMENMLENRTLWVLSRQKIEIIRLPEVKENVTIETYPCGVDRLFALREYRLYDKDNQLIVRGTAAWLVLDSDTMRPKRLSGETLNILPDNSGLPASFTSLGKISSCSGNAVFDLKVRPSDIDMNRHLNNANYAAMVQDAVYSCNAVMEDISSVEINYLHSGQIDDQISVLLCAEGKNISVSGSCAEKPAFTASVTLK